jgi:hypothetical protein
LGSIPKQGSERPAQQLEQLRALLRSLRSLRSARASFTITAISALVVPRYFISLFWTHLFFEYQL